MSGEATGVTRGPDGRVAVSVTRLVWPRLWGVVISSQACCEIKFPSLSAYGRFPPGAVRAQKCVIGSAKTSHIMPRVAAMPYSHANEGSAVATVTMAVVPSPKHALPAMQMVLSPQHDHTVASDATVSGLSGNSTTARSRPLQAS